MKIFHFAKLSENEKGLTLMELLICLVIGSIIITAVTMTTAGIFDSNARSTAHETSVKQVENAVHWISRDVLEAQSVALDNSAGNGLPAVITWMDWDNTRNVVTYTMQDTLLRRRYLRQDSGGVVVSDSTTTVAVNISRDTALTKCRFSGGVFTLKLTSAVAGFEASGETRVIEIIPRPGQTS